MANWEDIVCRSSTLFERLGGTFACHEAAGASADARRRLDTWSRSVADGDPDRFARRLNRDGLDAQRALSLLGQVRRVAGGPLPGWVDTLSAVVSAAQAADPDTLAGEARRSGLLPRDFPPVPFEEVWVPFLEVASRRLRERAGRAYGLLAPDAHASLLLGLLGELVRLGTQVLYLEFSAFRAAVRPAVVDGVATVPAGGARQIYLRFVRRLFEGGLFPLFQEFSVLARRSGALVDLWVDSSAEFLSRLEADLPEVRARFGLGQGDVVALGKSRSDRHNGGRTVVQLVLASGASVLYKPRTLGIDGAYAELVAWLNDRGAPLPLRAAAALDRGTHGWAEFIEHRPCSTRNEARRYHRRAGMLLSLVHALGGMDFHCQNVIACGEFPVLVDLETILSPGVWMSDDAPAASDSEAELRQQRNDSVLQTGFLPYEEARADGGSDDGAGLSCAGAERTPAIVRRWSHVNTDGMEPLTGPAEETPERNVPFLGSTPLAASDFTGEIEAGFREMSRFLEHQREALLAPGGPLAAFRHQQIRFLPRPTVVYACARDLLCRPALLRESPDADVSIELLARPFCPPSATPTLWPLLRPEFEALGQADIPYFTVRADSEDLRLPGGEVVVGCLEPAWPRAIASLYRLGEEDLERQSSLIRASLNGRASADVHSTTGG